MIPKADNSCGTVHNGIIAEPLANILKRNYKKIGGISIAATLLLLYCCKKIDKSNDNNIENSREYKYHKEIIKHDLGNNEFLHNWAYIGQNDTIVFKSFHYKNNVIDSSKSLFYQLNLKKISEKTYSGNLTYYYDSIHEGKLYGMSFHIINQIDGKTNRRTFESEKENSLELNFKNDNDTIMGIIIAYHTKKSSEKGKVRMRQIHLPVDNYNKTDNPFIGLKPEW